MENKSSNGEPCEAYNDHPGQEEAEAEQKTRFQRAAPEQGRNVHQDGNPSGNRRIPAMGAATPRGEAHPVAGPN